MGTDTCTQRVWASGDTEDCGRAPTIGDTGLCEECLERRLVALKADTERLELEAKTTRERYEHHLRALEDHRLPLLARMRRTA